jgi:hypothetical protein
MTIELTLTESPITDNAVTGKSSTRGSAVAAAPRLILHPSEESYRNADNLGGRLNIAFKND